MKKVLSLLFFVFLCQYASAQRVDKPGASYDYFCFVQRFLSDWARVITDSGQSSSIFNENGEHVLFDSDVALINYMTKRGWVYVESIENRDNMVYVMKKSVTNDKNAFQGILLEEKKKE